MRNESGLGPAPKPAEPGGLERPAGGAQGPGGAHASLELQEPGTPGTAGKGAERRRPPPRGRLLEPATHICLPLALHGLAFLLGQGTRVCALQPDGDTWCFCSGACDGSRVPGVTWLLREASEKCNSLQELSLHSSLVTSGYSACFPVGPLSLEDPPRTAVVRSL